jgi:hypothetical protein
MRIFSRGCKRDYSIPHAVSADSIHEWKRGLGDNRAVELSFIEDSGLWKLCRPLNFLLAHPS